MSSPSDRFREMAVRPKQAGTAPGGPAKRLVAGAAACGNSSTITTSKKRAGPGRRSIAAERTARARNTWPHCLDAWPVHRSSPTGANRRSTWRKRAWRRAGSAVDGSSERQAGGRCQQVGPSRDWPGCKPRSRPNQLFTKASECSGCATAQVLKGNGQGPPVPGNRRGASWGSSRIGFRPGLPGVGASLCF